jgi:hypothetical protein
MRFNKTSFGVCLYIILVWISGKLPFIPEYAKAFLSTPLVLIIPYAFAFITMKGKNIYEDFIVDMLAKWIIGLIIITYLSIILNYFNAFSIVFYIVMLALFTFCFMASKSSSYRFTRIHYIQVRRAAAIVATVLALIPVIISSIFVPFPHFGMSIDAARIIIQPVLRAIEDGYLMPDIRPAEVILAIFPCYISGIDPAAFLWTARFLLAAIFSIGMFLLALEVYDGDTHAAVMAAVIASWAFVGSKPSTFFFDVPAQHFRSNVILYAVFPLVLLATGRLLKKEEIRMHALVMLGGLTLVLWFYFEINEAKVFSLPNYYKLAVWNPIVYTLMLILLIVFTICRNKNLLFLYTFIFTCFLFHVEETILFAGTLFAYIFFMQISKKISKKPIIFFLLMMIIGIYFSLSFILNTLRSLIFKILPFPQIAEWASFDYKLNEFLDGITLPGLLLLVFSSILSILAKDAKILTHIYVLILLAFVYFLPFEFTYRIFKEFNIFFAIISSYNMHLFSKRIKIVVHYENRTKFVSPLIILVVLVLFLSSIYLPIVFRRFSSAPPYFICWKGGIQSYLTSEEWEAASWLREHLPSTTILISDYFTMFTLTPLANKVWCAEKSMDPPEQIPYLLPELKYIKEIFLSENSTIAYEKIVKVRPMWVETLYLKAKNYNSDKFSYVIIVSKRTLRWIELREYYGFVLDPCFPVTDKPLKIFNDERYFQLIYENDFLKVYYVRA